MHLRLTMAILIACSAATAQDVPKPDPAKLSVAGVQTPWDAKVIINKVAQENESFQPVLEAIHPEEWVEKGASVTYVQQWHQAQQQIHDVVYTAKMLAQKPEQLSLAMDTYFRLEALDSTARSIEEGIRHYGDRSSADKLSALIAHNYSAREQFRDYLTNLATTQEQNFKIADQEAQRCRGIISREPAQRTKK